MKTGIHPEVHHNVKAHCSSCGADFILSSTVDSMAIESCSACHPVYTGKVRKESTAGRVKRFRDRQSKSQAA